MALVPFPDLMAAAARAKYAVGYFEAWNLESLLAVADAAAAARSPVLLGFSGIYLPHPARRTAEHLADYYALAHAVAARLPVPCCLVFNESPDLAWVHQAIALGFGLVMYSDETAPAAAHLPALCDLIAHAHARGLSVEAEMESLAGVGGELHDLPADLHLTDPQAARAFVAQTGIDALAVNVGQTHLHGRRTVSLDLDRLRAIREHVSMPLVLHGATSVAQADLRAAIAIGVQKINVGSALKRTYFDALRRACAEVGADYNPYEVVGSGTAGDVLTTARLALQAHVTDWMHLFNSANQA